MKRILSLALAVLIFPATVLALPPAKPIDKPLANVSPKSVAKPKTPVKTQKKIMKPVAAPKPPAMVPFVINGKAFSLAPLDAQLLQAIIEDFCKSHTKH